MGQKEKLMDKYMDCLAMLIKRAGNCCTRRNWGFAAIVFQED